MKAAPSSSTLASPSLNCLPTQFSPLTYQTISSVHRAAIRAELNVVQIEKQKIGEDAISAKPGAT